MGLGASWDCGRASWDCGRASWDCGRAESVLGLWESVLGLWESVLGRPEAYEYKYRCFYLQPEGWTYNLRDGPSTLGERTTTSTGASAFQTSSCPAQTASSRQLRLH